MKAEPPEGADPEAFWQRVDQLSGREGHPRVTAIRIARLEALGIPLEDRVRARARNEPKLRTHPETEKLRQAMIEQGKR